jgi:glycosyltransferase involved in cell wall biosynthesis
VRVLLSAFSCEPDHGSEREVGFRTLLAAASRHEVWLLTRAVSVPVLQRYLTGHHLAARIHLEAVPQDFDEDGFGRTKFHWYYDRWQRSAAERAVALNHHVDFDVVHHVSLATVWTRAGVATVPRPLVWGPVGGGVEPPLRLLPELGWRGALDDLTRIASRRLLTRLPPMRLAPNVAAMILAQNDDVVRRLHSERPVTVLPNATAVELNGVPPQGERTPDVLFVSRLLAWKGGHLAIRALRHINHREAVLRIYGEGPDGPRLKRAAHRWGIADRVQFKGWVPRHALLSEVARAGVLVHPSFHDDAPLCVAEALSLGTPVVCLDHGGPAEVVRRWSASPACLVAPTDAKTTARRLAEAIDGFLAAPPPVRTHPIPTDRSFADAVLDAYDQAARSTRRGR